MASVLSGHEARVARIENPGRGPVKLKWFDAFSRTPRVPAPRAQSIACDVIFVKDAVEGEVVATTKRLRLASKRNGEKIDAMLEQLRITKAALQGGGEMLPAAAGPSLHAFITTTRGIWIGACSG